MGLPELPAVDLGFGLEQPGEDGQGPVLDGRGEAALEDDALDVGEVAFVLLVALDLDVDLEGGETAAADAPDGDLHGQAQPGHLLLEEGRIDAQVEEGAEAHVPADPRGRVEIDVFHRSIRISFSP